VDRERPGRTSAGGEWDSETKTEQGAIETRGTAGFDDLQALLVVPVQQLVRDRAGPLYVSSNASEPYRWTLTTAASWSGRTPLAARLKGFEPRHLLCLACRSAANYPATCLRS
jgi:hypothetical protein